MAYWLIYSLRRGNRNPFYVGATSNWRRRLKEHKAFYGSHIILDFLEEGDGDKAERDVAECYWIEAYRGLGYKLANKTEGGDDAVEIHSAETRALISAALKGRVFTAEHRAKIGAKHKGKIVSAETRAKISAAATSQFADQESRRAHSEVMMTSLSAEKRSEIGRLGALALMAKDPEAHKTRMLDWWSSMSPEEREAFAKMRASKVSREDRSARAKAGWARKRQQSGPSE